MTSIRTLRRPAPIGRDLALLSVLAAAHRALSVGIARLWQALIRHGDIKALSELDAHQLNDIGLSPEDVRTVLSESAFFRSASPRLSALATARRCRQH